MRQIGRKRTLKHALPKQISEKIPLIGPAPDQMALNCNTQSPRRIAPRIQAQRHKALPPGIFHRK